MSAQRHWMAPGWYGRHSMLVAPLAALLATLLAALLAGCGIPQPFASVPAQRCMSQRQGSFGAAGGVIIPLSARDPTTAYHTSALFGVQADTGALAWSCASTTYAGWDDARLINGVLYAIAGTEYSKESAPTHVHAIFALRPRDGKLLWTYSFRAGMTSPLAFDNGLLFVSATTSDGSSSHSDLYAIHTGDGSLAWLASYGDTISQPLLVNHQIVVAASTTTGQDLRAIREQDGAALWSTPLAGATPPVSLISIDGMLYTSGSSAISAYDGASGALRWTQTTLGEIMSALIADAGALIFTTSQNVFAFDGISGALRWSAVRGGRPTVLAATSAAVYAMTQAADGQSGTLFTLDAATGRLLWQRVINSADSALAGISPGTGADAYLTLPTRAQKLTSVIALDQRGGDRWRYDGQSPYSIGMLLATSALLYYIWQAPQDGVSGSSPDITHITCLRVADGAVAWTTPLPAYNADPVAPLLAP